MKRRGFLALLASIPIVGARIPRPVVGEDAMARTVWHSAIDGGMPEWRALQIHVASSLTTYGQRHVDASFRVLGGRSARYTLGVDVPNDGDESQTLRLCRMLGLACSTTWLVHLRRGRFTGISDEERARLLGYPIIRATLEESRPSRRSEA